MNTTSIVDRASEEIVQPNAASLVESLRDIGYTLSTAVADVIDNSLTAGASKVSILVDSEPDTAAIGILDDGSGMSRDALLDAMRPGSTTPTETRDPSDLGRFGLGLKTASFSQCRRLTVVTRQDDITSVAVWDLDLVVERNEWVVALPVSAEAVPFAEQLGQCGTLVVWEKLDRAGLEQGPGDLLRMLDEASRHLELVFHRFMRTERSQAAVAFDLNGRPLEPMDPFAENHEATVRSPEDRRSGPDGTVTIQPFVLPHRNKVRSQAEWNRMGLIEGHMRSQGFYLYRNRRLIRHATWFGLARQHRLTELARIRIDIGNESDAAWKIDVLKASAAPPPSIRRHLRSIVENLGIRSKQVYRKRGAKLTDENPLPLWQRTKADGRIAYSLNPDHPVLSAFADALPDDVEREFGSILRLVAAGLPLEALHHDMADGLETIRQDGLDEAEVMSTGGVLVSGLREMGHDDSEILAMLRAIPPYSGAPQLVRKLLGEAS